MAFQLSYFKSWKMMLWKCHTQYVSKFGKLSSGHRTRKGQFSFQSQRKTMPKNAQTTAQLHSLVTQAVKRVSTMWETWVWSLGWEDSLEKEIATHSSTLALKIPWSEELGAGYYPWGRKELGTTSLSFSHTSKVMLKILQARLQQYMNHELPDVQAGFRKGRGTRDQIANNRWIIKKARVPERHLFLLYWLCQSLWLCGLQNTGKFWKIWKYQTTWPASWEICMQGRKQQLELDMEQQTGSK